MNVFISIIVPMYNAEKYIGECIGRVLQQTDKDFELILIDDGSTDNTYEICQNFAKKDSQIKLLCQQNAGPSAARNKGIKVSQGEWIWFVDADDWIEKNAIEKIKNEIEEFRDSIDVFSFDYIKHNKNKSETICNSQYGLFEQNRYVEFVINQLNHFGLVWSNIYSTKLLKENNIAFDEELSLSEDVDFSIHVSMCVNKIYISKLKLYHYRITNGSLSHKYKEGIAQKYIQAISKIENNICKIESKQLQKDFNKYVQIILIYIVLNDYFNPENDKKLSYRKKQFNDFVKLDVIQKALLEVDCNYFNKSKTLLLYFIKYRFIFGIIVISKIRHLRIKS